MPNPTSPEFEVDKWATSDFVVRRMVPHVGIHPYPLDALLLMVAAIVRRRPAHVYEWGTHHGASARIFREAAMAFGVACRIDSIDLPDDVEHIEHPHESRGHLVRGLPEVHLHQGEGLDVSLRLPREVPDTGLVLFFLDGDHAYASVRRELTAIAAAAPEASFLLHDTFFQSTEAGYNVGPQEALAEFLQSHEGEYGRVTTSLGLPGMTLLYPQRA